jgi:hypothetical protein
MSVPIESKSAPIKKLQMIGVDVAKHKLDVSIDNYCDSRGRERICIYPQGAWQG